MSSASPMPASDVVRLERLLPGPIERVWRYLTESALRKTWLAEGDMDLAPGGKLQMTWHNATLSNEAPPARFAEDDGSTMHGTVLACAPPCMLHYTWPMGDDVTHVLIELQSCGDDVLLTLTHSNLGTRKRRVSVSAGWTAHLEVLQQRLAGTEPIVFWAHFTGAEERFEAIL